MDKTNSTTNTYRGYILPEGVEPIQGKDGLFHTKSSSDVNQIPGQRFIQNPPPILDTESKLHGPHAPFDYNHVVEKGADDLLKLIHFICKEEGEIVAFRRAYLQRKLKAACKKYRADESACQVQEMQKAEGSGNKIRSILDLALQREPKPLPTINPPEHPGWLAINEAEHNPEYVLQGGRIHGTKHHPLKIILDAFIALGYLKKTELPHESVPDNPAAGLDIYEPTGRMIG